MESQADPNQQGDNSLQKQLLQELLNGNLPAFEDILKQQEVDPYYVYNQPYPNTCLDIACESHDRIEFVRVLLERGYRRNTRHSLNTMSNLLDPTHYKTSTTDLFLLSHNSKKVEDRERNGNTLLHSLCSSIVSSRLDDYKKCIKLIVEQISADELNVTNVDGYTAFDVLLSGHVLKKRTTREKYKTIAFDIKEKRKAIIHGQSIESLTEDAEHAARSSVARLLLELTQGALDVDSPRPNGRCARNDVELRFPELLPLLPPPPGDEITDPHMALIQALHAQRLSEFCALLSRTDSDGNLALDPNHVFRRPLGATCLELAAMEEHGAAFIVALLEAGADPNLPNPFTERCAVHEASEAGRFAVLYALFRARFEVDPNRQDRRRNTGLHCALGDINEDESEEQEWEDEHEERSLGRLLCFQFLLELHDIDCTKRNGDGLTPLMLAVKNNNKEAVKSILLSKKNFGNLEEEFEGKTIREVLLEQFPNLEHIITSVKSQSTFYIKLEAEKTDNGNVYKEQQNKQTNINKDTEQHIFQLLHLRREHEFVEQISQLKDIDMIAHGKFTLLQRAARYGLMNAVIALLKNGADPNKIFKGNKSPPLVLASEYNHPEVIEIILRNGRVNVNACDSRGNTALHYAAKKENNLPTVILLLNFGADPNITNILGIHPFNKMQLRDILNQCIKTRGINPLHEDYELIFEYSIFTDKSQAVYRINEENQCFCIATKVQKHDLYESTDGPQTTNITSRELILPNETKLLYFMSGIDDLSELLYHPVAYSYLQLKWSQMKFMTLINLIITVIFIVCLNVFIISSKTYCVQNEVYQYDKRHEVAMFLIWPTLLLWSVGVIREVSQFVNNVRKYMRRWDNYSDIVFLSLSATVMILPFYHSNVCTDVNRNTLNSIYALTIMMSCVELLQVMSRVWFFAKHIEMLKIVLLSYVMPLISYCVILVAFGLSFFTLFYSPVAEETSFNVTAEPIEYSYFDSWYLSIVKTIVMMTGELDLASFPDRSAPALIIFIAFVLVVTIVLLNLLVGLAVRDIQILEDATHKLRLITRVDLIYHNERAVMALLSAMFRWSWFRCLTRGSLRRTLLRRVLLFPGATTSREARVRPNVSAQLVMHRSERGYQYFPLEANVLKIATSIVSERSQSRALTLEDLDASLKKLQAFMETHLRTSRLSIGNIEPAVIRMPH